MIRLWVAVLAAGVAVQLHTVPAANETLLANRTLHANGTIAHKEGREEVKRLLATLLKRLEANGQSTAPSNPARKMKIPAVHVPVDDSSVDSFDVAGQSNLSLPAFTSPTTTSTAWQFHAANMSDIADALGTLMDRVGAVRAPTTTTTSTLPPDDFSDLAKLVGGMHGHHKHNHTSPPSNGSLARTVQPLAEDNETVVARAAPHHHVANASLRRDTRRPRKRAVPDMPDLSAGMDTANGMLDAILSQVNTQGATHEGAEVAMPTAPPPSAEAAAAVANATQRAHHHAQNASGSGSGGEGAEAAEDADTKGITGAAKKLGDVADTAEKLGDVAAGKVSSLLASPNSSTARAAIARELRGLQKRVREADSPEEEPQLRRDEGTPADDILARLDSLVKRVEAPGVRLANASNASRLANASTRV